MRGWWPWPKAVEPETALSTTDGVSDTETEPPSNTEAGAENREPRSPDGMLWLRMRPVFISSVTYLPRLFD